MKKRKITIWIDVPENEHPNVTAQRVHGSLWSMGFLPRFIRNEVWNGKPEWVYRLKSSENGEVSNECSAT